MKESKQMFLIIFKISRMTGVKIHNNLTKIDTYMFKNMISDIFWFSDCIKKITKKKNKKQEPDCSNSALLVPNSILIQKYQLKYKFF